MIKEKLIREFNALNIPDLKVITSLNKLCGAFINLEYTLPSGQKAKLWDDAKTYYGAEVCRPGSNRCYGLAADESHLMVAEYGDGGSDPELIIFKKI